MDKSLSAKIKTLAELADITKKFKREGKIIVHCHGVFDLIHPGHIKHLSSAKKHGDILVVTITADNFVRKGPGRPIFNENLRAEFLASILHVDYVAVNNDYSAIPAIYKLKPDFYVKGPDYKKRKNFTQLPGKLTDEESAVKSVGGKLIYTDDILFSSSKLINDYLENYPPKTKTFLSNFRQKYSAEIITEKLLNLTNLKIMIIGDAIIDQYHYCIPMGKSSKEPMIVHKFLSDETFLGGTLATANHTASISKKVNLVTVLGKKNSFRSFINSHLKPFIKKTFFYRDDTNTVIKRRFVDPVTKQKLFQITIIKDDFIPLAVENKIVKYLKEELPKYDLAIVNDFGHGLMSNKIIRILCKRAKYLALNVQANSANYGFNVVTKYPKADFVCIDEQELRLATHDKYSSVDFLIKKIFRKMKCRDLIVTRGSEGAIIYSEREGLVEVPSMTDKIVDRMGAGDSLFAVSAPCIYTDMERELVAFVGNVAGALQVQTVGNKKSVELSDITRYITRLLK